MARSPKTSKPMLVKIKENLIAISATVIALGTIIGGGITVYNFFAKEARVDTFECELNIRLEGVKNSVTKLEKEKELASDQHDLRKLLAKDEKDEDDLIEIEALKDAIKLEKEIIHDIKKNEELIGQSKTKCQGE